MVSMLHVLSRLRSHLIARTENKLDEISSLHLPQACLSPLAREVLLSNQLAVLRGDDPDQLFLPSAKEMLEQRRMRNAAIYDASARLKAYQGHVDVDDFESDSDEDEGVFSLKRDREEFDDVEQERKSMFTKKVCYEPFLLSI